MYIKTQDYEVAAGTTVRKTIEAILQIKKQGLTPAKCTVDYVMEYAFPPKWEDDGKDFIWTKHNERELRKFVETEIKMWEAGFRKI